ncbi:MAG: efflux RND transporter periplasmic adaptor subunit [Myxococcales bacterium]|nr:efflux RND transporter periplasmic adaptor subunit [Myxococcales bacterium]
MTSRSLAAVAFGLGLALAGACKKTEQVKANEPTPEPLAEEATQAVEPEAPAGFIGVLTPKSQAEVVAPFSTTVKQYLVSVGDPVEAGAKLAVLDDAPLKEALSKVDAELKGAQASYASAASNAGIQLKAYRAGVAAKTTYLQAEGATAEAKARLDGAKASYEATKTKLGKTSVVAPIAGRIALQFIKPGGQVTEGSPILRVISSDELYVRFAIPTDQSNKLQEGMPIDLLIDSHGDQVKARGKVTSIQPELDPIARMIFAEAELVGEIPAGLQAGLVCRIKPAAAATTPPAGDGSGSDRAAAVPPPPPTPAPTPAPKPAVPKPKPRKR